MNDSDVLYDFLWSATQSELKAMRKALKVLIRAGMHRNSATDLLIRNYYERKVSNSRQFADNAFKSK